MMIYMMICLCGAIFGTEVEHERCYSMLNFTSDYCLLLLLTCILVISSRLV